MNYTWTDSPKLGEKTTKKHKGVLVDSPNLGRGSFLATLESQKVRDWARVIQKNLQEMGISGFAKMVYASHREEGILSLIQTAGLGALQPNSVLASWPFSWVLNKEARVRFIKCIQACAMFEKVLIIAKEGHKFPENFGKRMHGPLDIWWVVSDGGIMLLLPWLLKRHDVWQKCKLRLFAIIDANIDNPHAVKVDLLNYLKGTLHSTLSYLCKNVDVKTVVQSYPCMCNLSY